VRGDRYTRRRGELVFLSRERRCMSHGVKICFKKTRQRMASGEFFKTFTPPWEPLPVPHFHECPGCGHKFTCHGVCPVTDGTDPLDEPFCNLCQDEQRHDDGVDD